MTQGHVCRAFAVSQVTPRRANRGWAHGKSSWCSGDPLLLHFMSHSSAWGEALSIPRHSPEGGISSLRSSPTTAGAFCCPPPGKVPPGHSSLPELQQVPVPWLCDTALISSTPRAPALLLIHLILQLLLTPVSSARMKSFLVPDNLPKNIQQS